MARTTFYQARYQCWPPVHNRDISNANSRHWEDQARAVQSRLAELLGDDFRLWAEIIWPGEGINSQSWKQIHDTCQWALDHQEATNQTLECTCNPAGIGAPCPVCRANARIREREEISND